MDSKQNIKELAGNQPEKELSQRGTAESEYNNQKKRQDLQWFTPVLSYYIIQWQSQMFL